MPNLTKTSWVVGQVAMIAATFLCQGGWAQQPQQSPLVLHIEVLSGEGVVHRPNATSQAGLIVRVTDQVGRAVPGAVVSFHLPANGPSGTFSNGLQTEIVVTDADGRAEVWGLKTNSTPGEFVIRVTAAKGKARAGTLIHQFIAAPGQPIPAVNQPVARRAGKKWLWLTVIAAGVAGGLATALVGNAKPATPNNTPANGRPPASSPSAAIEIGQPEIRIRAP